MVIKDVLLVDDEIAIRNLVRALLTTLGYKCQAVGSGEEALGLVQSKEFDLVVTDLKMPGMNGDVLAEEIKRLKPNLPVLLITGNAPVTVSPAIDGVLLKPFTRNQLRDAIAALAARSGK